MSVSIQAKKRQKCFMIDPKDGVVQEVPSFTSAEEQGFAISKLELWKKAGVTDFSEVIDPNHRKLLQFQDITTQISPHGDSKNISLDAAAKMKNALESAQKAAAELSMLVQLSSLLQSNQILSLQTRYVDSSAPMEVSSSMDQGHKTAKDNGKAPLPVPQRIGIQRASFSKAKQSILSGLEQAQALIKQRQEFANTLRQCQEDRSFRLCYVDRKSNKRVTHRKYEPRKDFIAADCSVHVLTDQASAANNAAATNANVGKGVKWTARTADPSTTSIAYVPILMGKKGIELSATEQAASIYTMRLTLLAISTNVTRGAGSVVGEATAWDLISTSTAPASTYHDEAEMEVEDTTTDTTHACSNDSVQALAAHCQRRKHETLCRTAFSRLQDECIRGAAHWDVLSGFSSGNVSDISSSEAIEAGSAVDSVLRGTDALRSSIVVVDVQEREVVLRVSEKLVLVIALVPIVHSSGSSEGSSGSINSSIGSSVRGVEWVSRALSAMALQALLETLQPSTATSALSNSNGNSNRKGAAGSDSFAKSTQWRALTTHKVKTISAASTANTTNASNSRTTTILTTRLLNVLISRVDEQRAGNKK